MDPASFVLRAFNRQEREEVLFFLIILSEHQEYKQPHLMMLLFLYIKMQLDFTLQNGLEAVRILVLEGFDKSATFVNSAKPLTV